MIQHNGLQPFLPPRDPYNLAGPVLPDTGGHPFNHLICLGPQCFLPLRLPGRFPDTSLSPPCTSAAFNNLGSINVLAARLWLDKKVQLVTPSNVLVGFDE